MNLAVRVKGERFDETLTFLENTWRSFIPTRPFVYSFLDDRLHDSYVSDERLGNLFGTFSVLAIVLACLGLLGLTAYTAEQRTKEVGIRKILGASSPGIVFLLAKEFGKLVVAANLLAWPIAYYVMGIWLQDFSYRIHLEVWVFSFGTLMTFAIAFLTVSYQAIKAASANPADSLRYE